MNFLKSKTARILTLVLLCQAGAFYGLSRPEQMPPLRDLTQFQFDSKWISIQDQQIDQETRDVLKADSIISRVYKNTQDGAFGALFVAYFQTQRTGKAPHSPKNCLPGSGFVPTESGAITIPIASAEPITVNRYIVAHGDDQSVVLYWYQSHNRVIASEYSAKFYTMADAIRYHRSDTALVRVVVEAPHGDTEHATAEAVSLVQDSFTPLKTFLGE